MFAFSPAFCTSPELHPKVPRNTIYVYVCTYIPVRATSGPSTCQSIWKSFLSDRIKRNKKLYYIATMKAQRATGDTARNVH